MPHKVSIYTPLSPVEAAADNAETEKALRLPRVTDNEIIRGDTVAIAPENIPMAVLLSCPALQYLIEAELSKPESDGSGNLAALHRYAKRLADAAGGIAVFSDTSEIYIGNESERFLYPALNEYTPMLTLACFFEPRIAISEISEQLISLLEAYMPPALPSEYGVSEPPEHKYIGESKRAELTDFLKNEPAPVWYAHYPITHVLISDAARRTAAPGLRASRIALTLPLSVWEYTEWQMALKRLLCELMRLTNGFFGQIVPSDKLGVAAWWWQGIPSEVGYTFMLGEPYASLVSSEGCVHRGGINIYTASQATLIPAELVSHSIKRRTSHVLCRHDIRAAASIPIKDEYGQ